MRISIGLLSIKYVLILWHLYLRIQRIPTPASLDTAPEDRKTTLEDKSKALLHSFTAAQRIPREPQAELLSDRGTENKPTRTTEDVDNVPLAQNKIFLTSPQKAEAMLNPPVPSGHVIPDHGLHQGNLQAQYSTNMNNQLRMYSPLGSHPKSSTAIPVYKWNVKFDYESGQSVGAFLQRVEELRRARGISQQELFESAVDLFEGKYLTWYRSAINRVRSWEELCNEMRIVFQTPDYNFRLQ
ncbi:hypothetical protein J6590_072085 [Homalodisca vitripennis]|nr:hypothetical protein J6590_072085 [Homalodisca vitripennis]